MRGGASTSVLDPGVGEVVEVLEHLVVRRRDREVQVRHRPHRAADVVRGQQQVIRVGPAGQALHGQEAAEVREVHLDDVHVALLEERTDVLQGMRALAGGDGQARGRAHPRQRGRVLRRHRLLDPFRIVGLEEGRHLRRRRRREPAVHLDHDLHVGADGVAHGGHDGDGLAPFGPGQLGTGRAERIELQPAVPALHHAAREARDRLGIALGLVPAIRVGGHAIAEAAAEELPERARRGSAPSGPSRRRRRRPARTASPRPAVRTPRAGRSRPAAPRRRGRRRRRSAAPAREGRPRACPSC